MFDPQKFIRLVEEYECIWKKSSKNAEHKQNAWDDIAKKMYCDRWLSFSTTDRVSAKIDLQKKWRNIKDSFRKEVKKQKYEKSGVSRQKKSKYMFYDYLMFLLPEVESQNRTSTNTSFSKGIEQLPSKDDNSSEIFQQENSSESRSVQKYNAPSTIINPVGKHRSEKSKSLNFKSKLLKMLSSNNNEKSNCKHDEDESFFHSLLPSVKKLDDQQKLQFRMEVLNSLRTVRNFSFPTTQHAVHAANFNSQQYYPHQLQIYSIPQTQPDVPVSDSEPTSTPNVCVTDPSQLVHVSIASELPERKIQNVNDFPNNL